MNKFTEITESKKFMPDPSLVKMYAARIIPYYITGELKCDPKLIDEWLEMNKSTQKHKNQNVLCDLEILAVKNILDNPTSQGGYTQLVNDVDNKCAKLERFIRSHFKIKN